MEVFRRSVRRIKCLFKGDCVEKNKSFTKERECPRITQESFDFSSKTTLVEPSLFSMCVFWTLVIFKILAPLAFWDHAMRTSGSISCTRMTHHRLVLSSELSRRCLIWRAYMISVVHIALAFLAFLVWDLCCWDETAVNLGVRTGWRQHHYTTWPLIFTVDGTEPAARKLRINYACGQLRLLLLTWVPGVPCAPNLTASINRMMSGREVVSAPLSWRRVRNCGACFYCLLATLWSEHRGV